MDDEIRDEILFAAQKEIAALAQPAERKLIAMMRDSIVAFCREMVKNSTIEFCASMLVRVAIIPPILFILDKAHIHLISGAG